MKTLIRGTLMVSIVVLGTQAAFGQVSQTGGAVHLTPGLGIAHFNVGTAIPFGLATLRVRGDQLPVNDFFAVSRCTFRTDVDSGFNQNWSMTRFRPSLNAFDEIGRLWHTNPDNAFNISSRQADGNLWLRNSDDDGLRLNFNGVATATLNGFNLDRQGYAAPLARIFVCWRGSAIRALDHISLHV